MTAYLMSYHAAGRTWLDSDGLHLAQSADGLGWEPLHGPSRCETAYPAQGFGSGLFLAPTVGRCRFLENARAFAPASERGRRAWAPFKAVLENSTHCTGGRLLRDPFLMWHPPTSRYHALWTTGWASPTIGHASSSDLIEWSAQREIELPFASSVTQQVINAWAPEAYYDRKSQRTIIFWSTAHGIPWTKPVDIKRSFFTVYYSITSDWVHFTDAKPLLPANSPSIIDATMAPYSAAEGGYFLVYKHEVNKTLATAASKTLEGPYLEVAVDIAPGSSAEGPTVIRKSKEEVIIYFDRYEAGKYGAVSASRMRGPWTDISDSLTVPAGARHATVFRMPKAQVHRLRALYGPRERGMWRPEGATIGVSERERLVG